MGLILIRAAIDGAHWYVAELLEMLEVNEVNWHEFSAKYIRLTIRLRSHCSFAQGPALLACLTLLFNLGGAGLHVWYVIPNKEPSTRALLWNDMISDGRTH